MKRLCSPLWIVFAALFILLFAFDGRADDIRLFYANNSAWSSELVSIARTDVVIDGGQLFPPRTIHAGSETVTALSNPGFGVVDTISPASGELRQWTDASFNDGKTTNSVEIPPLPNALGASGLYSFEGIRNGSGRATFVAFVPTSSAPATARIEYFDGANRFAGSEMVTVDGYATDANGIRVYIGATFYALTLPLRIGRIQVTNVAPNLGYAGQQPGPFYAVAFVGRDSGKPRVEVPTLRNN